MQSFAFSIYDAATESYGMPFFAPNLASATRMFKDLVNDSNSMVHRHPTDFTLFNVGKFDDKTAVFSSCEPVRMMRAETLLIKDKVLPDD